MLTPGEGKNKLLAEAAQCLVEQKIMKDHEFSLGITPKAYFYRTSLKNVSNLWLRQSSSSMNRLSDQEV